VLKGVLRWLLIGGFVGLAVGALGGLLLVRAVQLPAVEALAEYKPSAATQVRARDGSLLATFATERRIPIPSEQIPAVFRDAVLAAEDSNFYRHTGVDPRGILRAAVQNVFRRRFSQGASTITQQLARTLFLTPEKKLVRKLKEILLAIEIEQRFAKDQILTMYINQVYFGHGTYGVEAASRFFFGKPASQLAVAEAALLAGIIQRNNQQSPLRFPERALARRNYVLDRMLEEHLIDRATHDAAFAAPLAAKAHYDRNPTAAYFSEEVRRSVEQTFGTKQMLAGGLAVETTLDPELQRIAEGAVREGLVQLQRRLGWPGALQNLDTLAAPERAAYRHPSWPFLRWRVGELAYAVVMEVQAQRATLAIADRQAELTVKGAAWTQRPTLTRLIRPGDVVLVRLAEIPSEPASPVVVELEPEPAVEGSLVVLDNRNGAILALVGGFDYDRSEFDRAMQAMRQCGSSFKPFVYVAAFERGFSPNDTIFDGPALFPDEKMLLTYVPLNYYRKYDGIVTLRHAVEHSLNASAVKLQQMVTGEAVIDVARRLGVQQQLAPYPTMALGAFELPLVELTAAYAGIANRGQVAEPYFIARVRDSDGHAVFEARPRVSQALREDVAYLMTSVMEGVVQRGTATAAKELGGHLAGKTGTTDRYTDAWFIGFNNRITCGVWVGRDKKEPIGRRMTGAEAALPTWILFMRAYLDRLGEPARSEEFPIPAGIVMVPVDKRTGLRAVPECGDDVILEVVAEGREPADCSADQHTVVALPWEEQYLYYTLKPGEPATTPESVAAAAAKLAEDADGIRQ